MFLAKGAAQLGDPHFLFRDIVHPGTLPPRRARSKPRA
jgi:hypothetical protein